MQPPKPEPSATVVAAGDTVVAVGNAVAAGDAVELALAEALRKASASERWDVVAQLARELEARRLARAENVTVLAAERAKRVP